MFAHISITFPQSSTSILTLLTLDHELTLKIPNISTFRPQPRHQYVAEAHPQYEWIEHIYLGTVTPIDNDFALLEADEEQDRFVLSNQIKELNKAFDRDVVLLQQGVMAQWDGDGLEETMKQDEWEARLLRKVSNMDFT